MCLSGAINGAKMQMFSVSSDLGFSLFLGRGFEGFGFAFQLFD